MKHYILIITLFVFSACSITFDVRQPEQQIVFQRQLDTVPLLPSNIPDEVVPQGYGSVRPDQAQEKTVAEDDDEIYSQYSGILRRIKFSTAKTYFQGGLMDSIAIQDSLAAIRSVANAGGTPDWASIQNIPSDIADGDDDTNTQLNESQVDAFVANNGYLTEVADDAVTTAKIADDAVTSDKLANTGVTSGSYTNVNLTVNNQGQITAASNGSSGSNFIGLSEPYVYLFRLRGQSNALGQGLNTNLNASDLDAFSNVFIWNNTNTEFEALDIGTNNEGGALTEHGLEAGLARRLEANYSSQNFYILKTAIGGREINNMLPSASGDASSVYVKDSLQSIAAINHLISEGKIPVLIDVFVQGESDANDDNEAYLYTDKFETYYHTSNRYDINTPIVIAEIGGFTSSREIVNDAHAYASSVYENTFLIKSADYPRLSAGDSHFNYLGLDSIAIELYDLIKSGLVKGSPIYRNVPFSKPVNPGSGDSEYTAITDFASTQSYTTPSSAQQTAQQAFLAQLKSDGVWDRADAIYVFRTDGDSDFAKINWKNPATSDLATQTGTLTFTADEGFQGDGSTGFLTIPVSVFSNYQGADAGFVMEVVTANTSGAFDVGVTSGSNGLILSTDILSGNVFCRVNSTANTNVSNGGSGTGLWHWARTSNSAVNLYKDGTLSSAVNHSGSTLPTSLQILSHNGGFSNAEIGLIIIGDNLEDLADEIDAAYDTYKASL